MFVKILLFQLKDKAETRQFKYYRQQMNKQILILGAGRSAYSLIQYLLQNAKTHNWYITIGDRDIEIVKPQVQDFPKLAQAVVFDVTDQEQCDEFINKADLVISMLPARFHTLVARTCLRLSKSMVTASYVSPELKAMHEEAKEKGILFMNEIGLDPGIDHLSAAKTIDALQENGATITAFKSYAGGLVAPEYDNNPWNYKFTWNPRNVVLAGMGTTQYIQSHKYKYIPYHRLFTNTHPITIDGYGEFDGYPNRDSLKYRDIYEIAGVPTLMRGTLRRKGFCQSWNNLIQLGMTDDFSPMADTLTMTYRQFTNTFLEYAPNITVEKKTAALLGIPEDGKEMKKLEWLGLFSNKIIALENATPAQVLQKILEEKWSLEEGDKDMIVMHNIFEYELKGKHRRLAASMVVIGDDTQNTAMAKTVGLPLAITTKLILTGKIDLVGVHRPIWKQVYIPVLKELKTFGIDFNEEETEI